LGEVQIKLKQELKNGYNQYLKEIVEKLSSAAGAEIKPKVIIYITASWSISALPLRFRSLVFSGAKLLGNLIVDHGMD